MKKELVVALMVGMFVLDLPAIADVRLPPQFGNHMVLQRHVDIPVWGWADPGERVTVRLAGKSQNAVADAAGCWRVSLSPLKAGGPYELVVEGRNTITLSDVLIGEVWLGSGQSNMAMALNGATNAAEAIRNAACPSIRLFKSWYASRSTPQMSCGGTWEPCTPDSAREFSAVAYFFGRKLQHELGVPVGLIQCAVGGTSIESWVAPWNIGRDPKLKSLNDRRERALVNYPADLDDTGWQGPAMSDAAWDEMTLPQAWEKAGPGMETLNGVVWFRRSLDIPLGWEGKSLTLCLGPIDDGDDAYFNGVPVGAMTMATPEVWKKPRVYTVPGHLVKAGHAVIAVRVSDQFGGGGFVGSPDQMSIAPSEVAAETIPLAGVWRYRIAARWPENEFPTGLFCGMTAPWTHFALGGILWYQGESNANAAGAYRHLLPALIKGWRQSWGREDLPFLIVQLPNYMAVQPDPGESHWAELREAQALTAATLPGVGLVVTTDLGDPQNIHPKRKQEVGDRLASLALKSVYKCKGDDASPQYAGMTREGDVIRIRFANVGGGLRTNDGKPVNGFAIAGPRGDFVWATAKIEGDTVVVSNAAIREPARVRYAWADNPVANLVGGSGLLVVPFRADIR